MGKTVVLGASPNKLRFSNRAVKSLQRHNFEVVPIGIREGTIANIEILKGKPPLDHVHTVALYLNPENQKDYYKYILDLSPRRIIFNPGTVNPELMQLARENNIQPVIDCALIMLNSQRY